MSGSFFRSGMILGTLYGVSFGPLNLWIYVSALCRDRASMSPRHVRKGLVSAISSRSYSHVCYIRNTVLPMTMFKHIPDKNSLPVAKRVKSEQCASQAGVGIHRSLEYLYLNRCSPVAITRKHLYKACSRGLSPNKIRCSF